MTTILFLREFQRRMKSNYSTKLYIVIIHSYTTEYRRTQRWRIVDFSYQSIFRHNSVGKYFFLLPWSVDDCDGFLVVVLVFSCRPSYHPYGSTPTMFLPKNSTPDLVDILVNPRFGPFVTLFHIVQPSFRSSWRCCLRIKPAWYLIDLASCFLPTQTSLSTNYLFLYDLGF